MIFAGVWGGGGLERLKYKILTVRRKERVETPWPSGDHLVDEGMEERARGGFSRSPDREHGTGEGQFGGKKIMVGQPSFQKGGVR